MNSKYRLYLCTDSDLSAGRDLIEIVEAAINGGVSMVQLREKKLCAFEFYQKAVELHALTQRYSIPLIINDRVDIALAINAEGVHIGQQDLPMQTVRRIVPASMIVGVSVSTIDQAVRAVHDKADYIGVGPIFATATKPDAGEALSLNSIKEIKEAVTIPIVAIGGIDKTNIGEVFAAGADGAAVISAIFKANDPKTAAHQLLFSNREP